MIEQDIQNIIDKRRPFKDRVERAINALTSVSKDFEIFKRACNENKSLAEEFMNIAGIINEAQKLSGEIAERQKELKSIENRLSRPTLNIAVIGRARQGKSRLLQTITGLSAQEIPDGDGQYCTGVRSDIINNKNESSNTAYADVNFLTERKFLDEKVVPYFEALRKYKPNEFEVPPATFAEFKNINLPSPESFDTYSDNQPEMKEHLKNLSELQSRAQYYEKWLDHRAKRIEPKDIREYAAQYDKDGKEYFNFYAVDNIEIYCKFPNEDAGSLRLIDLPGLGDMRFGDVTKLVNALKDQADLVLFLSKPSNSGQAWGDVDIDLYSKARSALGDKLPIERWSFWVFNQDSRAGANNEKQCRILQDTIHNTPIKVAGTVIVDCTDQEAVSEKLLGKALNHLSQNIEQNDREYAENLQRRLNNTIAEINNFAEKVRRELKDKGDSNRDDKIFDKNFRDLWKVIRREINNTVREDSELRKKRGTDCEELKTAIESILDSEGANLPLTEEALQAQFEAVSGIGTAYEDALDYLRTSLTEKLRKNLDNILKKVLDEMKGKFCEIFYDKDKGRLELSKSRFTFKDYRLLGEMINFINNSGEAEDMPTILKGLEFLDGWTMSYRSFIEHRLRKELNGLDPKDPECRSQGSPDNVAQALEMLEMAYKEAADRVKQALKEVYTEPNDANFAIAEEFKDIMIRSDNSFAEFSNSEAEDLEFQWKCFYRPIRGDIWPEEFGNSQRQRDVNAKLKVVLNNLSQSLNNNTNNFDFLR